MNKIVKDIEIILINNFKFTKKYLILKILYKINNWDSLKHLQFIMLLEKNLILNFFDQNFNLKT